VVPLIRKVFFSFVDLRFLRGSHACCPAGSNGNGAALAGASAGHRTGMNSGRAGRGPAKHPSPSGPRAALMESSVKHSDDSDGAPGATVASAGSGGVRTA
jgi:hypothetical protein